MRRPRLRARRRGLRQRSRSQRELLCARTARLLDPFCAVDEAALTWALHALGVWQSYQRGVAC